MTSPHLRADFAHHIDAPRSSDRNPGLAVAVLPALAGARSRCRTGDAGR